MCKYTCITEYVHKYINYLGICSSKVMESQHYDLHVHWMFFKNELKIKLFSESFDVTCI